MKSTLGWSRSAITSVLLALAPGGCGSSGSDSSGLDSLGGGQTPFLSVDGGATTGATDAGANIARWTDSGSSALPGTGPGAGSGAAHADGSAGPGSTLGTGHGSPVTQVGVMSPSEACSQDSASASLQQLDLLIVQDKTGSMEDQTAAGPSKWTMITDALTSFVQDPRSADIGAGIEFFGGSGSSSCRVSTYENPAVPIAVLASNAAAIARAIQRTDTGGRTPTPVALQGALTYAAAWARANPSHKVILVLATDGLPNRYADPSGSGCAGDSDTFDPTALAMTLSVAGSGVRGSPSIPTYVIGVMAPDDVESLTNLNKMASAGGTGSAFIVDTSRNAEGQFLEAMKAIREANRASCDLVVPEPPAGQWLNFSQVSVTYGSGSGTPTSLGWSSSAASCPVSGGFYYDNNNAPTKISLCPTTCSQVQGDPSAVLKALFGCMKPGETAPGGEGGSNNDGGSAESGGGAACLLAGQSCKTAADCCGGVCNQLGYCGVVIK